MGGPQIDVSIVIPIYNEQDNIITLYHEITEVMAGLNYAYELIYIDDGSEDSSYARIKSLSDKDQRIVCIRFRRNFGQTAAFSAGFDNAQGDIIITMDGDLQNDPADIPLLLEKIKNYDVVSGWRKNRKDNAVSRKLPSKIANKLISWTTGVKLNDYGCSLKAYRKDVINGVRIYGEMHRFIPAILSWVGISYCEVPIHHRPRTHGKSKYGISRTIPVLLDLITVKFLLSYSTRPIQVFGVFGICVGAIGLLICSYLAFIKLFLYQDIGNRPLLLLGVLMIILSAFLIVLGLLGEILVRIYYETQNKPIYHVREVSGSK